MDSKIFNQKKAETNPASVLVTLLIILAIAGSLIFMYMRSSESATKVTDSVTSCSGMSITKGTCVKSADECESNVAFQGLGCEGETPVCCASSNT